MTDLIKFKVGPYFDVEAVAYYDDVDAMAEDVAIEIFGAPLVEAVKSARAEPPSEAFLRVKSIDRRARTITLERVGK